MTALELLVALSVSTRAQALVLLPLAVLYWAMIGYRWRPAVTWGVVAASEAVRRPATAREERALAT